MTRVAVIDIGTNSTRLLIADVSPAGAVQELLRRSTVTRLGEGADSTGALALPAIERTPAKPFEHLLRRSPVARLGEGVDSTGALALPAIERTRATLTAYRRLIDGPDCTANLAVLTSAVRDATNR